MEFSCLNYLLRGKTKETILEKHFYAYLYYKHNLENDIAVINNYFVTGIIQNLMLHLMISNLRI